MFCGQMGKDWDKAYDIGETPWDKGYASPALNAFLESYPLTGSVLVPGCGTGHDVRLLAAQGTEVVGIDIAPSAIRKAKAFHFCWKSNTRSVAASWDPGGPAGFFNDS